MRFYSRVAVIGPQDSINDCIKISQDYPSLSMKGFPYESEEQARGIIKSLGNQYDVILFTGPLPYFKVKDMPELSDIPNVCIPFNGNGLYRSLFQVRDLEDFGRISVDTIHRIEVESAFRELGLSSVPTDILEYEQALTLNEYVDFHKNLYDQGKTDTALTCIRSCYLELKRLEIPVARIYPLQSDIRETLDRICLIMDSIWYKGYQISVGVVSVDRYHEWANQKGIHDSQRLHLQLNQSLVQYIKEIDGHFIHTAPGEFLFFTTRSLIEKSTENFNRSPNLMQQIYLPEGLTLSLGIGIGGTANLAAERARLALQKAREEGGNCSFVVNENHQVIGKLGKLDTSILDLRTTDDGMLDAVEKTGLSAATLSRLFNAIHHAGRDFTSNEVASYLGMTVRSARRLLQQLEQAQLLEVVGQESLHTRGKPRRVYRLVK
jgi:hypothetical protein